MTVGVEIVRLTETIAAQAAEIAGIEAERNMLRAAGLTLVNERNQLQAEIERLTHEKYSSRVPQWVIDKIEERVAPSLAVAKAAQKLMDRVEQDRQKALAEEKYLGLDMKPDVANLRDTLAHPAVKEALEHDSPSTT